MQNEDLGQPVNPYKPVQLAKEESDATHQAFGQWLFANWFTRDLLLITLLLGIVGFIECLYTNSYYSWLQIFGSLTLRLRHSSEVSPSQLLIRTVVELGLAYLTTVVLWYAVIMGFILFVPGAFSH